jgi:N-dimethylarginine dimethylaminohydrolase
MVSEGEFQAASGQGAEDKFKEETGLTLREMYQKYHPQVLADFEDEMLTYWGRKWKANTNVGKLRVVLVHRPGKEFLSVGNPTPWPPHDNSLGAWRMSFKPDLDELIEHHENLVAAYKAEGVEVVIRKPDDNNPPYQVKAIYTDDVCHPGVYGSIILRMYDHVRKGEEVQTYKTLAEIGCPVIGMIVGNGMVEGGSIGWLDEKHVVVAVHYPRVNTKTPEVMRANEFGHEQFARIIKTQDPTVDVRLCPGYGTRIGASHYTLIDRHTSIQDPRSLDQYLVDWMKAEMNWEFIVPPEEICRIVRSRDERAVLFKRGPETGVVLEPRKILVPTGAPKATKWFESIGVEVVEVECSSLVGPKNSGSIHCAAGSLVRDSEPKSY